MSRRHDESDSEMERAPLYDPPVSRRRSMSASSAPRYRRGSVSAATRVPLPPDSDSDRSTDGEYENAADGLPARMSRPVPNRRASVATLSDDEIDLRRPGEDDGTEPTMIRPSRGQYPEDLFGDSTSGTEPRRVASMSKGWEKPGTHHSNSMEDFLASIYDLGKTIDNLENDIDQINALRIKIKKIDPEQDVGHVSIRADLDALSALTTLTGKTIVSVEQWLMGLYDRYKDMKAIFKGGQADFQKSEVAEIKLQIADAKLMFAEAMNRVRLGAFQEQDHRQRTRNWMAYHIRSNEPDIENDELKGLLEAAELGAQDGIADNHVTSYAGLWALNNPFTELAELTNGMSWLEDDLDRDIVNKMIPKPQKGRVINLDPPTRSNSNASKKSPWFGSRAAFVSSWNRRPTKLPAYDTDREHAEKDLEWAAAKQAQAERAGTRKKMTIVLLVLLILLLVALLWFATVGVNDPDLRESINSTTTSQTPLTTAWYTPATMSNAMTTATSASTSIPTSASVSTDSPSWWQHNTFDTSSDGATQQQHQGVVDWMTSRLIGSPSLTVVAPSMAFATQPVLSSAAPSMLPALSANPW